MEIVRQQQDEDNPAIWYLKLGGVATGGEYRLADITIETNDPAAWVAINQVEAQVAIDAGSVNEEYNERRDFSGLEADIVNELGWIGTATADIDTGLGIVDSATTAQMRAILRGLLENQKRILQEQSRELKAWRFVIRRLS